MRIYVESSALLASAFAEPDGDRVRTILASAEIVVTSEPTLIECDRAMHRAVALRKLSESDAADRRAAMADASAAWEILKISDEVVDRSRQAFPLEPIRAPDAIHLASALVARAAVPGVELLTLDDRIRAAAKSLGLPVRPE